ncbi:MAG TPA: hypothetical protein PK808_06025 [Polymorphobacter sp.]|jgi:hypothetical protein|nr:hypothetical protein [Polymorphobacter sp.]
MTSSIAITQAGIALRQCLEAAIVGDAGLALARMSVTLALLAHAPVVLAALPAASAPGNRIQVMLLGATPVDAPRNLPRGAPAPLQLELRYRIAIVAQSLVAAELMTGVVIDAVQRNARLEIPLTATDPVEAALLAGPGIDRAVAVTLLIEAPRPENPDAALILRVGPVTLAG